MRWYRTLISGLSSQFSSKTITLLVKKKRNYWRRWTLRNMEILMSITLSLKSLSQGLTKWIKTLEALITMTDKWKIMECRRISCQLKTTKNGLDLSLPICQLLEAVWIKVPFQDLQESIIPKTIIYTWISLAEDSNLGILVSNTLLNISSSWAKKQCSNRCLTSTSILKCQQ
jgi:hypothetical protein